VTWLAVSSTASETGEATNEPMMTTVSPAMQLSCGGLCWLR
jgi:hypothetical protein